MVMLPEAAPPRPSLTTTFTTTGTALDCGFTADVLSITDFPSPSIWQLEELCHWYVIGSLSGSFVIAVRDTLSPE
jgi:hypothetical protein